jgi:hypothetical protein
MLKPNDSDLYKGYSKLEPVSDHIEISLFYLLSTDYTQQKYYRTFFNSCFFYQIFRKSNPKLKFLRRM